MKRCSCQYCMRRNPDRCSICDDTDGLQPHDGMSLCPRCRNRYSLVRNPQDFESSYNRILRLIRDVKVAPHDTYTWGLLHRAMRRAGRDLQIRGTQGLQEWVTIINVDPDEDRLDYVIVGDDGYPTVSASIYIGHYFTPEIRML